MRLIDADALLKQLGVSERFNADIPPYVLGIINGMESPVCKNCKYYNLQHHVCERMEESFYCPHCEKFIVKDSEVEFPVNGFCSYYERKRK